MRKIIATMAICSAVICSAQTSMRDEKFAKCAAEGGVMEVKTAQLALTRGTSQKVKDLAQTILADHSKANEELKGNAGVYITQLPQQLSKKDQKMYDKLARKSGSDFDKCYSKMMVKDHKHDICLFKKEAKKGNEPLKGWASGKVPVLEKHLAMAKEACKDAK